MYFVYPSPFLPVIDKQQINKTWQLYRKVLMYIFVASVSCHNMKFLAKWNQKAFYFLNHGRRNHKVHLLNFEMSVWETPSSFYCICYVLFLLSNELYHAWNTAFPTDFLTDLHALIALWVVSDCSLIAPWLLWSISDLVRWRLTALDKFEPDGQTDGRTLAFLELLS